MRKIELHTLIETYDSVDELDRHDKLLIAKAEEAREFAYAPFSNFKVGAALLMDNNHIVPGNNQENSSFPAGTCAERTAVSSAASQFPNVAIKAIAVVTSDMNSTDPTAPCGICRQTLVDLEQRFQQPIRIILKSGTGRVLIIKSAQDLMPLAFVLKQ